MSDNGRGTPPPEAGAAGTAAAGDGARRAVTGRIFEVQRFCIDDGPGIRTTVFMKGCPLRCQWCHNPEGADPGPVLSFQPEKCIGCGYCVRACPNQAHQISAGGHTLVRARCAACGACAVECYAGALELVGRDATVGEVIDEVERDREFYRNSGGGMTLSGGEPLLQLDFAAALLAEARARGLHTCVETAGFAPPERYARVRPLVDQFLFDLKETDDGRHRTYTGQSNRLILQNLRDLCAAGSVVRLRLPIIPGLNDRDDHFAAVARLAASLPALEGVQVMPYHPLGTAKLERLGLASEGLYAGGSPSPETVAGWVARLRELGVDVVNGRESAPRAAAPAGNPEQPGPRAG
ncbi:MAG: glycyl-radical enzyme activating protein [Gemmatimonadota bacterium]